MYFCFIWFSPLWLVNMHWCVSAVEELRDSNEPSRAEGSQHDKLHPPQSSLTTHPRHAKEKDPQSATHCATDAILTSQEHYAQRLHPPPPVWITLLASRMRQCPFWSFQHVWNPSTKTNWNIPQWHNSLVQHIDTSHDTHLRSRGNHCGQTLENALDAYIYMRALEDTITAVSRLTHTNWEESSFITMTWSRASYMYCVCVMSLCARVQFMPISNEQQVTSVAYVHCFRGSCHRV